MQDQEEREKEEDQGRFAVALLRGEGRSASVWRSVGKKGGGGLL